MEGRNNTAMTYFILVGLSGHPRAQVILFCLLLVSYLIILLGNSLILFLVQYDSRLHNPMYFFLSNLSFLDICFTSASIPQMIINCLVRMPVISAGQCVAQLCALLYLVVVECLLLAVMAYDRCIAISDPLRYPVRMHNQFCIQLSALSWVLAFFFSIVPTVAMPLELCSNIINHFFCEVLAVIKLACSDLQLNELVMMATSSLTLLVPFVFILASYGRILGAVLKIRSTEGRKKAFSTCSSHLTVVVIFYGTAMAMYMMPQDKTSRDQDKLVSLLYGVVTPMLNPLIYSLRNKDVKEALRKLQGEKKVP
ncbi:olfactory receptor 13H1-like [Dromiciops gliroides]|uniref:olfactory receptor 13H1-like n=1 Tax=Dromiciops gliroides TaxID=33562 RepID=UPI001CC5FAD7|nr:olfactory receptor 13H1-like [Dromiciops gliroides]